MSMTAGSASRHVTEPVDGLDGAERERADDPVQQATLRAVDEAPQQRDDDHRHDHRDEVDRPEDVDAAHSTVDEQRQQQCESALDRHDHHREHDRVDQGADEDGVSHQDRDLGDRQDRSS